MQETSVGAATVASSIPAAEPASESPPPRDALPLWRRLAGGCRPHIAAMLMAIAVVAVCRYNQHPGHDYGDDFSLYIRQAKAITNGRISEVIRQNEFALDHSSWHTFSQRVYPWGFPIMLAPLYWLGGGINYGLFKLFEAVTFGAFLLMLYAVIQKRAGRLGAFVVMTTIGLSAAYVGWTDTVLSDLPYLFVTFVSIWLLDRVRVKNLFESDRLAPLIVLGVAVGYAFSTRKEGVAVLAAVLAAQLTYVANRWRHRDHRGAYGERYTPRWSRLAAPLVSFIGFIVLLRLILPAPFIEHYAGTGLKQLRGNLQAYGFSLAEQIGLKDPGRVLPGHSLWSFFGSPTIAKAAFAVFLGLTALGIIVRVATAFSEDIALLTYLVVTTLIIGVAPFRDSRYIFSLTPLLVYFAFQGIVALSAVVRPVFADRERTKRLVGIPLAATMIGTLAIANGTDTWHRTKFRHEFGADVLQGAALPTWQELFAEVRSATRPDDVIAFFRARTMILYTDRNAIQSQGIATVQTNATYFARHKELPGYSQPSTDPDQLAALGFTLIWENDEFQLWQVPKQ